MLSILMIIIKRLGLGALTLFMVSVIIFAAVNLLPGDFAQAILGQSATPEAIAAIRHDLGLDNPPIQRYFIWLFGVIQGDFGRSFADATFSDFAGSATGGEIGTVADKLSARFGNTIFLASVAAIVAVPLSIFIGVLAALYRNSIFDRVANVSTLASISSPEFFLAYILILLLAVINPFFPSISNINDDLDLFEKLQRTMLPALTLILVVAAHMMRMTRAAIINLLAYPFIEMARLKGLSPFRIILFHALPNALAPIINVVAINLAFLITGVVVVEVVFVYPGVGQLFVDSVKTRDVPVVQACCLIFATAYVLLNLTADIMSIISNPRLRHPR